MEKINKKIVIFSIMAFLIIAVAAPIYVWEIKPPEKVSNLSVDRENGSAILTWEDNDADYYLIYKNNELISTTQKNQFIDNEIKTDESYNYKVTPVIDKEIGKESPTLLKAQNQEELPEDEPQKEEDLKIINKFKYIGDGPNPYVVLEIQNNGNKNIRDVDVEAAFYLGDEEIGSTRKGHWHEREISFEIIKPQEKMAVTINLVLDRLEIREKMRGNLDKEQKVDVFIENYSTTSEDPYLDYDLTHSAEKTDKAYEITGEVTNTGQKTTETTITTKLYNNTYGLIGQKHDIIRDHKEEATEEFEIKFRKSYFKLQNGEVYDEKIPLSEIVDDFEIMARGK